VTVYITGPYLGDLPFGKDDPRIAGWNIPEVPSVGFPSTPSPAGYTFLPSSAMYTAMPVIWGTNTTFSTVFQSNAIPWQSELSPLGRQLLALQQKAMASGMPLLSDDEIAEEIARRRSSHR
jgi:hypothetical protein